MQSSVLNASHFKERVGGRKLFETRRSNQELLRIEQKRIRQRQSGMNEPIEPGEKLDRSKLYNEVPASGEGESK